LDGVRKVFEENSFPQVRESTQLALATLGNDAGVIGAASLVLQ
jgi:glucokinase